MKHTFKIIQEEEQAGCWIFQIAAEPQGDAPAARLRQLRLSWEDYDLWVRDGTVEPAAVAMAILKYLESTLEFTELPERIDSSFPRRHDQEADGVIAGLIDPVMFRGH